MHTHFPAPVSFPHLQLHHVAELEPAGGGSFLRRYPRALRDTLTPLGRLVSGESSGCEIRFVTTAAPLLRPLLPHSKSLSVNRDDLSPSDQRRREMKQADV